MEIKDGEVKLNTDTVMLPEGTDSELDPTQLLNEASSEMLDKALNLMEQVEIKAKEHQLKVIEAELQNESRPRTMRDRTHSMVDGFFNLGARIRIGVRTRVDGVRMLTSTGLEVVAEKLKPKCPGE